VIAHLNTYVIERTPSLTDRVYRFRDEPVESMREVAVTSAGALKSLTAPVRAFAHSGVRLATVSQTAMQNLIQLESEVITSTLTAAARRLERAAGAENIVELVLDQADMLGATRDRLLDEAARAVEIFKVAGRDLRKVGAHLYGQVFETAEQELPKVKTAPEAQRAVSKASRTVRKSTARVRKAAA